MKGKEQYFYSWLRIRLNKAGYFTQRIENSTERGIPDLFVSHPELGYTWIELKAVSGTNVQIRKEQYAWFKLAPMRGVNTCVINCDPMKKIYTGFVPQHSTESVVTKTNYVKLTKPCWACDGPLAFEEFIQSHRLLSEAHLIKACETGLVTQ